MVAALIALHYDSATLYRALAAIGAAGLIAVAAVNFVAVFLSAAAWRCLLPDKPGVASYLWFRYARNAAADLFGFVPAAGELVAVREMFLHGIECHLAAASLIADLTVQLTAQIAFTSVGMVVLIAISPSGLLTGIALAGVAALASILTLMIAAQRCGIDRALTDLVRRVLPEAFGGRAGVIGEFTARLRNIYSDRCQIGAAITFHVAAWFAGTVEAGVILVLVGAWPGLKVTLVLESLILGLRTAAFFIPGAWGVQEAAYLLIGSVFGLASEAVLALILVKRARELVVGVLVLFIGQMFSVFLRARA